jgi:hypothetical protein
MAFFSMQCLVLLLSVREQASADSTNVVREEASTEVVLEEVGTEVLLSDCLSGKRQMLKGYYPPEKGQMVLFL